MKVKQGAADQKRNAPTLVNRLHLAQRIGAEFSRGIGLGGVPDINQPVRCPLEFLGAGFGRADVHAPVDLGRIHADDFDRQHIMQRQRQRGLAGSRGAHEADGNGLGNHRRLRIFDRINRIYKIKNI